MNSERHLCFVFLLFYIPESAIGTPQSKKEVILCYGSWMAPGGEQIF